MKKRYTFILASVVICLLISSCQTSYSVLKRHYTKGYYIARQTGVSAGSGQASETMMESENSDPAVSPVPEVNRAGNSFAPSAESNAVSSPPRLTKPAKRAVFKSLVSPLTHEHNPAIENSPLIRLPFQTTVNRYKIEHEEREGLSLFWLIILVILILWALGFLAGGFGLGGLINLLLLIALILFILWLLRII